MHTRYYMRMCIHVYVHPQLVEIVGRGSCPILHKYMDHNYLFISDDVCLWDVILVYSFSVYIHS